MTETVTIPMETLILYQKESSKYWKLRMALTQIGRTDIVDRIEKEMEDGLGSTQSAV